MLLALKLPAGKDRWRSWLFRGRYSHCALSREELKRFCFTYSAEQQSENISCCPMPEMAVQMTDSHRRFLQILMSHGIMEGSEARALHRHCCEVHKVHYAHDKLDDFIDVINLQLQPLFMHIRKGMSEDDGRRHYALVNLAETEVTKMASDYAENELELFRKTMDLIIMSDNGLVSSTNVLNLTDELQVKKMKKKEAEQVLQSFVQDKWLFERQACETCGIQMHLPCVAKYFKGQTEPHCPNCNEFWPHEIPDIARSDSQQPPPEQPQQPSTSQKEQANSQREKRSTAASSSGRRQSKR
ncbi:non-structural maintenance of chromosomes element 1 homolog isoform X2 [Ambystoma mexicanum]|uniref:non-structural maintenance of chromosomes element 1 homolog isoform X2 n=1 Tax=Ambystoma mexicanum TaxID=8296 RepID=UPI0037E8E7D3